MLFTCFHTRRRDVFLCDLVLEQNRHHVFFYKTVFFVEEPEPRWTIELNSGPSVLDLQLLHCDVMWCSAPPAGRTGTRQRDRSQSSCMNSIYSTCGSLVLNPSRWTFNTVSLSRWTLCDPFQILHESAGRDLLQNLWCDRLCSRPAVEFSRFFVFECDMNSFRHWEHRASLWSCWAVGPACSSDSVLVLILFWFWFCSGSDSVLVSVTL